MPIISDGSYDFAIPLTIDRISFFISTFNSRSFLDFLIFFASRIVPIFKFNFEMTNSAPVFPAEITISQSLFFTLSIERFRLERYQSWLRHPTY